MKCAKVSYIENHAWTLDHVIDFDNAAMIDRGTILTRKTLESWQTTEMITADNNSCPLPKQYSILLNKH